MTNAEGRELLTRLAVPYEQHKQPWDIERKPHNYPDGTTRLIHVSFPARMSDGSEVRVVIGSYLTSEIAELLTLTHNNMADIIAWARKGLEHE